MNEVESPLNVWNEHPPFPIKNAPVFVWPPRPVAALKYLLGEERVGHGLLDEMFGSFHDGTPEATARIRQRLANRRSVTGT